ncbi:type II 3-dehydroquinate dehydratase [Tersicoccus sp. Bi-70]|uniref:type II 3-dehydroquinate dehydratase n=1 Tax=Tersicoccus sp. Bi-70 TaxID=1897634 RepID=UPI000976C9ED|nr:type II 3-dehydroquinate dehydratase [Tersicoccus sp. Bi-70]OMH34423.1 type II 3-dehydroquinate dehydratase [Tersicoccus sp. Bi-70]
MSDRRSLLVLNGPNLNLLGTRKPETYGHATLADVEAQVRDAAAAHDLDVQFVQSNHEGALLDAIHAARGVHAGIVINPGAYSHTSIALPDALEAVQPMPVVEVHISNVHRREAFRHHSYVSAQADAVIIGAGVHGYTLAVEHLARLLTEG